MREYEPFASHLSPASTDTIDTTQAPTVIQEEISKKRKRSSLQTSDIGVPDVAVHVSTRRQGIGHPRLPSQHLRLYDTSRYILYDPEKGNVGPRVTQKFRTFAQYDEFTLFMNPAIETFDDIPTSGVRLDDMTVAFVMIRCTLKTLYANWPADFDLEGMIRARRVPLGHAAKFWKAEGDVDVDGNVVPKGEAGYYYKWWRGLHCLCGKEGLDRNLYMIRPYNEKFKCLGFGFKVSSRAIIQLPSDDPRDPTFTSATSFAASSSSTAS